MRATRADELDALADKLAALGEDHHEPWHLEQQPHNYPDGTTYFNHVQYRSGEGLRVGVASYVTPELGDLLITLHNRLDDIVSALRAQASIIREAGR